MRSRNESGFATAQMVVLLVVSFTLLAWFANVLFIQYERAAARTALADAARQAARTSGSNATCEDKIAEIMQRLANGPWQRGEVSTPQCTGADDPQSAVTAKVNYQFRPWFPGVPDVAGTMSYTAQRRGVNSGATP